MNLPTEIFDDVIVVHTPEELGADQARCASRPTSGAGTNRVVLDLDGTEIVDSKGLTALLNIQDHLRQPAAKPRSPPPTPVNRKILEITRLDQHLEIFDSVIDAVKSFH